MTASRSADIFLSIGTSSLVQPAASLPLEAKSNRIPIVEINPQPTPLTPAFNFVLAGPAGEVLPELLFRCFGREGDSGHEREAGMGGGGHGRFPTQ